MTAWTSRASHQWATRPDDERYVSLTDMFDHFTTVRDQSKAKVVSTRKFQVQPATKSGNAVTDETTSDEFDCKGLTVVGEAGVPYFPTNWAFNQLAQRASAPAGYLATLPSPIAADALNASLRARPIEDVGLLLQDNGDRTLRAATGPRYGRIWNAEVVAALIRLQQEQPHWTVPGEFGKAVEVTKANTTLYASDRDMFVFLTDEINRIEIPNRRDGKTGGLARGFFMWNSEVGKSTYGLATFMLDYVCMNRMIWGGQDYQEIRIRHTAGAPDRFLEEVQPALISYANASAMPIVEGIRKAQEARVDDVDEFLSKRFGARKVMAIKAVHDLEEGRPIETLFDVTTAVTAFARGIKHQDVRIELEKQAGDILQLAA